MVGSIITKSSQHKLTRIKKHLLTNDKYKKKICSCLQNKTKISTSYIQVYTYSSFFSKTLNNDDGLHIYF